MPKDIIQLSIQCNKCGATNKFSSDNIPTFCSFCGGALPDMRPHVDEAIRIALTNQKDEYRVAIDRQYHEMDMESKDKDIKKEKVRTSGERIQYIMLIAMFVCIVLVVLLFRSFIKR